MPPRSWQVFAALALLLSGCASAADRDAAQAAARKEWGDCVMQAAQRFDDGKTDPTSIAYGIAPKCAASYSRLTELMVAENYTQVGQLHARALMAENETKLITSAILTWRNRAR